MKYEVEKVRFYIYLILLTGIFRNREKITEEAMMETRDIESGKYLIMELIASDILVNI